MRTSGRSVLVTGGGTGIGLALARALIEAGSRVAVCGRRREVLVAAEREVPGLLTKVCDVASERSRRSLAEWLERRLPDLDILVNNAGIQRRVDFLAGHRDLAAADAEIRINLAAPIHLTALLLPRLRQRRGGAAIVNVSSGLGFTPVAMVPVYSATKAALHSWTLSLRHQLRSTRVRVFEVAPPIVPTDLREGRPIPPGADTMEPGEVAEGIVAALARDDEEVALGAAAHLFARRDALFSALNDD